jgi:hypothetical protein
VPAQAGRKGGGGNVGGDVSGIIFTQFTQVEFDPTHRGLGVIDNAVGGDGGGLYVYNVDNVETFVGRNFNIIMDFNTKPKKPSIRKIRFPNGFPTIQAVPAHCCQ